MKKLTREDMTLNDKYRIVCAYLIREVCFAMTEDSVAISWDGPPHIKSGSIKKQDERIELLMKELEVIYWKLGKKGVAESAPSKFRDSIQGWSKMRKEQKQELCRQAAHMFGIVDLY